ncbi:unnamed protein product [Acanthoscelides obtectus]|nr:unnamed protein product [Acanthoscelides obtectus]CAK1639784.1 hypothetical protein AOBTE_LOCUS11372 [Acanthoscelides obtectus]
MRLFMEVRDKLDKRHSSGMRFLSSLILCLILHSESSVSPEKQEDSDCIYICHFNHLLFMDEEMYNFPGSSNEEQYVHTSSTLSASESDSAAKTAGVQEHMLDKKKRKR